MRRHEINYPLCDLYVEAQVTAQAVSQHRKRRVNLGVKVVALLHEMDQYRRRHPGCGLEKLYYQLNVTLMGRDNFIAFAKDMGYQLRVPRSSARTTLSGNYTLPNLIEGMLIVDINRVWQSDITYFRVGEVFYYLTFIIDVYSRKVISYAVSKTLEAEANISALKRAIAARGCKNLSNLIHHSDRGSQYTSNAYLALLFDIGSLPSMGLKGQDNAYAERLNGIIKNEYLRYRSIATYSKLKYWVKQAVDQYNSERIHNSLPNRLSPILFEELIVTLNYQKRPKVIIYAEGKTAVHHAQSMVYSLPEKALQAHICPIYNLNIQ